MVEIIAIDGPASVGKSTLAKKISNYYEVPLLNSGRLYRAVALKIINKKININNKYKILKCAKSLTDENIKSESLFSSKIDKIASEISSKKYLRKQLMIYQREFPRKYAKGKKFAVIEGRDIGTEIFPQAKIKIFMWADAKIRAKRRYLQIKKKGQKTSLRRIYDEIVARDMNDLNRKIAPLRPAVNSVLLDTSYLDIEQAFNAIKRLFS
ncbi:MAG: cytidylate kinase [Candidatus Pelagibacterales bacterium]|nr:MAG: cytidylate kinase [Pelagibacterales bacterium]